MMKAFVLAAMRPKGPYPVLVLNGRHGSAKSTTAKVLRLLIDPNEAPIRAQPRDERDLFIAATNSWVQSLDNISYLPNWLSDALCGVSTGRGFATRELHTDEDEILFNVCRPCVLNGIEEIATREDLIDRALLVELPEIKKANRKSEKAFWEDFNAWRPAIMAYFLDSLVGAMGNISFVELSDYPRMADFAQWSIAAENPLGLKGGEFLQAYSANRREANAVALESSPIATYIGQFIAGLSEGRITPIHANKWNAPSWEGTATELLDEICKLSTEQEKKASRWPKSARSLSGALKRLASNLSDIGIEVVFTRNKNTRNITLKKTDTFENDSTEKPTAYDANDPSGDANDAIGDDE